MGECDGVIHLTLPIPFYHIPEARAQCNVSDSLVDHVGVDVFHFTFLCLHVREGLFLAEMLSSFGWFIVAVPL